MAVGDLDGVNGPELAVANLFSDDVSVLLNQGDGTFAAAAAYGAGDGPSSVAIGDLDGVNGPDLAVANYVGNDVSILLSLCQGTACPYDLNADGAVDETDLRALLAAWGADPGGPPDLDGDGTVGVRDFLELLAHWGPCR